MKIIISPAKKMKIETDIIENLSVPIFQNTAKDIAKNLAGLDFQTLKKLFVANDKITQENFLRYQEMDFERNLTPAILAYDGIQYKYMSPSVFEDSYFAYIQKYLRILSGLYGVLKPLDGVVSYRLEMQAKLKIGNCQNLYEFWNNQIYKVDFECEDIILNLASKEYCVAIKKHANKTQRIIDVIFGEIINDKIVEKGVYVKMARGEMVRYMAENAIEEISKIKEFNRLGYTFSKEHSNENKYVFIKESKND